MRMHWIVWPLLLAAPLGLLAADVEVVEQIVAKVNGDVVLRSDLVKARQQLLQELQARGLKGPEFENTFAEMQKHLLRDKIDELLLLQRAKELNLNVDSDVSKYLAQMQLNFKITDPDQFQKWVEEQSGMSYQDFREQTKNQFLTRRVIGMEVQSRINVSRQEIEKYYEEHKNEFQREDRIYLQEILISTVGKDAKGVAEAEAKAKSLAARARSGEKFNELAQANSDADTARNGGDLGAFQKGVLRKDIEDLVWDKERGFVTDPIKVPNGFLVLRVAEKHQKGIASLEEVENEIREKLTMPRFEPAYREYLSKLRENAFLEIREDYVDTGAVPGKDTSWTDPGRLTPQTITREEVAAQIRRKRLIFFPIPGTQVTVHGRSSSR